MGRPIPGGIGDLGEGIGTTESFRSPGMLEGDELFNRTWRVTIQTTENAEDRTRVNDGLALQTTQHDIKFKVIKSIKSEPNKCTLEIFNLNAEHRNAIAELNPVTKLVHVRDKKKLRIAARKSAKKGIGVKIEAGYHGDNSLIWLGDMRTAESEYIAPNWITKLTAGDGEKAWQNARVNVSYGPKTPTSTALNAMVKALGLGAGNTAEIIANEGLTNKIYPQGTVMSGPVATLLTDYCRSADLEWSIVDGAVQFTGRGKALKGRAILVSANTGMLGSPKVDIDGVLTVKTVLIPDVRPGRLIVVEASQNAGNYRAEQIIYEGESDGTNWGLTLKCTRY
jgi:hypothetical protein